MSDDFQRFPAKVPGPSQLALPALSTAGHADYALCIIPSRSHPAFISRASAPYPESAKVICFIGKLGRWSPGRSLRKLQVLTCPASFHTAWTRSCPSFQTRLHRPMFSARNLWHDTNLHAEWIKHAVQRLNGGVTCVMLQLPQGAQRQLTHLGEPGLLQPSHFLA